MQFNNWILKLGYLHNQVGLNVFTTFFLISSFKKPFLLCSLCYSMSIARIIMIFWLEPILIVDLVFYWQSLLVQWSLFLELEIQPQYFLGHQCQSAEPTILTASQRQQQKGLHWVLTASKLKARPQKVQPVNNVSLWVCDKNVGKWLKTLLNLCKVGKRHERFVEMFYYFFGFPMESNSLGDG